MPNKHRPPHPPRDPEEFDPSLNPQYANVPAEAEQPAGSDRFLQAFWETGKTLGFILLAAVIIRWLVIQPFFVDGVSMEPTIQPSNYLIINQLGYKLAWLPGIGGTIGPERGDIVVFEAPPEPGEKYIKRIVGIPGETVRLENGRVVIVNSQHPGGVALSEPYTHANEQTRPESETTTWTLGPEQYFVLGDNRQPGKSSDSRAWGPVPRANLIGTAWIRAYPISELGIMKHADYSDLAVAPLLIASELFNERR